MKRILDLSTVILAVCALVVTGLVVRRELRGGVDQPREPREIAEWEDLTANGHFIGPRDAPVKIVEFSDFQCPFCARVQGGLDEVRRQYPDEVAVVYRHFPLEAIHPHAMTAALASECAAEQGQFKAMHDRLFEGQDSIGQKPFVSFAGEAGVQDSVEFQKCLDEERYAEKVSSDIEVARSIDLRGTPSIIVDGTLLPGTPSARDLEEWVVRALDEPPQ